MACDMTPGAPQGLLEKSLFVTNADGLDELDGDDGGDVGKGGKGAGDDWGEEEGAVNSPALDADGSLSELEVCVVRSLSFGIPWLRVFMFMGSE